MKETPQEPKGRCNIVPSDCGWFSRLWPSFSPLSPMPRVNQLPGALICRRIRMRTKRLAGGKPPTWTDAYSPGSAYAGMGGELLMFDKVSQAYIEVYDGITNEYLGRAFFKLTPEVEDTILRYARNEKGPDRIELQDSDFYPASSAYALLLPFKKRSRKGIFKAMIRDRVSLLWVPFEIYEKYNASVGGGQFTGDNYYYDSVELSNIVVEGTKVMVDQITDLTNKNFFKHLRFL